MIVRHLFIFSYIRASVAVGLISSVVVIYPNIVLCHLDRIHAPCFFSNLNLVSNTAAPNYNHHRLNNSVCLGHNSPTLWYILGYGMGCWVERHLKFVMAMAYNQNNVAGPQPSIIILTLRQSTVMLYTHLIPKRGLYFMVESINGRRHYSWSGKTNRLVIRLFFL